MCGFQSNEWGVEIDFLKQLRLLGLGYRERRRVSMWHSYLSISRKISRWMNWDLKRERERERRENTHMLTTWQVVLLSNVQSQVNAFSLPLIGFWVTQPDNPLHGSTLKFQSPFPKLVAIACNDSTAKTQNPQQKSQYIHQ